MSKELKQSAPWFTFFKEFQALFGEDPAIKVEYNEVDNIIKLYVEGEEKYEALAQLLPTEKVFGNVVTKIEVIPANTLKSEATPLFQTAFEGNPVFAYAVSKGSDALTFGADYVVFKNKVVQFWNDELNDVNGNITTLYQEIAKDIFGDVGVFFCTDKE